MQCAPGNEFPTRAVPDPAEQHRQHHVAVGLQPAIAIAAQRLVEIVAQPGRQRNMPAVPEFAQPLRPIGLVEIGREAEAEQCGQRNRHVAVGAEIAVDLHRIAISREQQVRPAIARWSSENRIDQPGGEIIGDHDLFKETAEDQQQGRGDWDRLCRGPRELRQEVPGAHDRSRHELRKEGHVEEHVERVAAHRDIAAINIGDVGDAMKGEKRDADRQQDLEKRQLVLQPEKPCELVRRQY